MNFKNFFASSDSGGSTSVLRRVYKNSVLNILTQVFVVLVTFFAIPHILRGLGDTSYGILSLVLVFIGYFSLVDFGLGSAVVKFIADKRALNDERALGGIFTFACLVSVGIGFVVGILIYIFAGELARLLFKVPGGIDVIIISIQIVAATMPFMILQGVLKGTLMGYERFDVTNTLQAVNGVMQWGGIMVLVLLGISLPWIVGYVAILRFVVSMVFLIFALRITRLRVSLRMIERRLVSGMLGFGGWVMVSQALSPILQYLERFVLSATIATGILPFYVIPYDATSKLQILATALTSALFPGLSGISSGQTFLAEFKRVYWVSVRMLAYIMIPVGIVLTTFGNEILRFWIGPSFARESVECFQILVAAFVVNSIAQLFYTTLHALGKPRITGTFHMIELPIHIAIVFMCISIWGVVGAAVATLIRMVFDSALLLWANNRELDLVTLTKGSFASGVVAPLLLAFAWIIGADIVGISVSLKLAATLVGSLAYAIVVFRVSLDKNERAAILRVFVR